MLFPLEEMQEKIRLQDFGPEKTQYPVHIRLPRRHLKTTRKPDIRLHIQP